MTPPAAPPATPSSDAPREVKKRTLPDGFVRRTPEDLIAWLTAELAVNADARTRLNLPAV